MNEQIGTRKRRRELIIMLGYTIFSVLMVIITPIENWPLWYIPLIVAEIAFVWWSYINQYQTYNFRALVLTTMVCLNIFLYGVQGENFIVLIPTLCTQIVLLSLYEMTRVMDLVAFETVVLFVYQLTVHSEAMLPESGTERDRMMLQLLSFAVLFLLCVYRIHHHAQEEADFDEMSERVKREQKIKDDFVANTSHELRTPVNSISGMCDILLQKNLPDDVYGNVLDIQMTGVELQNIVTDILDYAALESDMLELHPREYNITSTVNDVMNMTSVDNKDKNLELIFDCNPNIPRLLEGDEQQLRRVLNDLISNAIKFTKEGGVYVHITYRPEEYGVNLIISVKDTGIGLTMEEQEQILRGFYQTDSDRNRSSSGMGLGLTLASALIRKMGGFLTIKSQPGEGSTFSFSIPQKVINEQSCISIKRPGRIKLLWYYNVNSEAPSMRDAFTQHVENFSEYFGIYSERATSLDECKRRADQSQNLHIIIGHDEYLEDKEYFDEMSKSVSVILITDRNEQPQTSALMHVLYKPYNSLMLAEIINGQETAAMVPRKKAQRKFVAPTAKILVVDDNLMNMKVIEGLLRKYRIKIAAAYSGEEALNMIETKDYDFVFMDHMMPGMDGVECFHHIREKNGAYFSDVPVIALTANAIAGSREMFLGEGFNDFVAKPIDTAQLHDILQRFIPAEKQFYEEDIEDAGEEASRRKTASSKKTKAGEDEQSAKSGKKEGSKSSKTKKKEKAETGAKAPAGEQVLPDVIDEETALMYCGTMEDFKELAEIYCKTGEKYADDLDKAYEDEDFKNYAILSHTIKSTSKTLGAMQLSELALAQEMAAKGEKEDVVKSKHEEFSKEYRNVLELLNEYLGEEPSKKPSKGSAKEAKEGEIKDWPAIKEKMLESLGAYEVKAFEDCLTEVKGLKLDDKAIEEVLSGVLEKANNFDFDGAIAELKEIGGAS